VFADEGQSCLDSDSQLRANLMSGSKITDHGFEVTFRRDGAVISDAQTGKRIATASRKSNL